MIPRIPASDLAFIADYSGALRAPVFSSLETILPLNSALRAPGMYFCNGI